MNSIFISGVVQGIDAAVATLFYKQGYKVGIYNLNTEKAQQLANNLGKHVKVGLLDVSNYTQSQKYGLCVLNAISLFVITVIVKDMNASAIHNIGVHFTAEDVT